MFDQREFSHIMRSLPVCVTEDDIEQMFTYADKDGDGQLSYSEFQASHFYYRYRNGNKARMS